MRPVPPRLKWHQLRRRLSDPAFWRANLEAGLAEGAALEVDLVASADGHLICLHDLTLDRETTGTGPARARTRREIERLSQRGADGAALDDPPLFLEDVVQACRRHPPDGIGLVQLDINEPCSGLDAGLLQRFGALLGDLAPAFTASGYQWDKIERLATAAPGLGKGFDPLGWHRADPPRDAAAFRTLAERIVAATRGASIYYLEAGLVLDGLDAGANLVALVARDGAAVDCWTLDPGRPGLTRDLRRLIDAGCDQITTNDPEALTPIVAEICRCS